jgi:23S rRNA pseudouridine1911/1915/1917 synthase
LTSEPFTVSRELAGSTLAAILRGARPGLSWQQARDLCTTGKVFVDGERELDPARRLRARQAVDVRERAPRPRAPGSEVRLVFEDAHVVLVDKPAGVSSVPYEKRDAGTAMDLIRDAWRRLGRPATAAPLLIVHRIDKDTSGLIVFAKSKPAEQGLGAQLRSHSMQRTYLCVGQGYVIGGRIESRLVRDRGDGLRGSSQRPDEGKRAVTHVEPVERLRNATLCRVRLETGKTHQIRIHMAERGHPLVGERVYIRDFVARGGEPIASPRLLLHAETLGFVHPVTGREMSFTAALPEDFTAQLARLR